MPRLLLLMLSARHAFTLAADAADAAATLLRCYVYDKRALMLLLPRCCY